MSFSPFAILTAEEMNDLVENIEALANGSGLDDDAVTSDKIDWSDGIWWEELGRTTLGGTADSISVASLPVRKYLRINFSLLNSGALVAGFRFNNDSASNYTHRFINDGTPGSATNVASVGSFGASTPISGYIEVENVAGRPKLGHAVGVFGGTSAGTAPSYIDFWLNWTNTADAISRIDFVNSGAGDFGVGSQLIVLGHD